MLPPDVMEFRIVVNNTSQNFSGNFLIEYYGNTIDKYKDQNGDI